MLPAGFVYLRDHDPTIVQDIRYAGSYNFIGSPIPGYAAAECILTREAADHLAEVQAMLASQSLSLLVWDCYRPERAVKAFVEWSGRAGSSWTDQVFFPRLRKDRLFSLGYIASRSSHSRGSTVDLGLMPKGSKIPLVAPGDPDRSCRGSPAERRGEGTLDFGTAFDCFDASSGDGARDISREAMANRANLRRVMERAGFKPYAREWWHFTLADEPYRSRAFDFPIVARP